MALYLYLLGTYDVFDNMVYPREESEGKFAVVTKLWDKAKSFFNSSEAEGQLVVPNHSTMQVECLRAYLTNMRKLLIDLSLSSETNIGSAVDYIMEVVKQLYSPHIVKGNNKQDWREKDVLEVCTG